MTTHLPWLAGAALAVAAVAGAVAAPSSWWAVAFVAGVVVAMLSLRRVVPEGYRPGWTRSVVLVTFAAVCVGGAYGLSVEPWGPHYAVAWVLGGLVFFAVLATVADAAQTPVLGGRGGAYANKVAQNERRMPR